MHAYCNDRGTSWGPFLINPGTDIERRQQHLVFGNLHIYSSYLAGSSAED